MLNIAPATDALFTLRVPPDAVWDDEQFFLFCQANREVRIERSAEGDLIIRALSGGAKGWMNAGLLASLYAWAKLDETGLVFGSSAGFRFPNGAVRSPDAAWVRRERLAGLMRRQWQRFLPLCPDFVIELRSPSDPLPPLQGKMEEYVAQGALLGWLIDPERQVVEVYRPNLPPTILDQPTLIGGDPDLPGFSLNLIPIWQGPMPQ